jgi:hypothetical protein
MMDMLPGPLCPPPHLLIPPPAPPADFITLQHHWSETGGRSCPPERMCAYVNNMRYFAHLLYEKQQALMEEIVDSVRINDVFAVTVKAFLAEAERSLTVLCGLVTADFREGLQEGLFKDDWTQSKSVAETLRLTLFEYLSDLKLWLKKENDIKVVLVAVLRVVSGSYLELLLTSGLVVTGGIGERLQQDFEVPPPPLPSLAALSKAPLGQVIQQSFRECGPYLQFDIVDREVSSGVVSPSLGLTNPPPPCS